MVVDDGDDGDLSMYLSTYIQLHIHAYTHIEIHIHIYIYMCVYVCVCVYIYVCMYVCVYIYHNVASVLRSDPAPEVQCIVASIMMDLAGALTTTGAALLVSHCCVFGYDSRQLLSKLCFQALMTAIVGFQGMPMF